MESLRQITIASRHRSALRPHRCWASLCTGDAFRTRLTMATCLHQQTQVCRQASQMLEMALLREHAYPSALIIARYYNHQQAQVNAPLILSIAVERLRKCLSDAEHLHWEHNLAKHVCLPLDVSLQSNISCSELFKVLKLGTISP